MKKKLLVISIDSMIGEDLEILAELPHFSQVLGKASVVRRMQSTYPTLTHSVHTSIITGCYPEHHGVINNELFMPGTPKAPWYEERDLVKVKNMPEQAAAHGYTTAYVFWPVTLHADVEWNLHRAFIHTPSDQTQQIIRERSTSGLYDEVAPLTADCWKRQHHEACDQFCTISGAHIIKTRRPDILYMHLVLIDHIRHVYGVHAPQVKEAYAFLDEEIGRLLQAVEEAGLKEQTIICFTSDHGQIDIDRAISINRYFHDHGLCEIRDGKLVSWKAYAHSAALATQIYVRDPSAYDRVKELLYADREKLGIGEIFTREEARAQWHTDGDYAFICDTDGRTCFSYALDWPFETGVENSDYRSSRASHGHLPDKGVQPCFFVYDPTAKKQVVLESGRIIDQAPTLAAMLGFEMEGCDGTVMRALIE